MSKLKMEDLLPAARPLRLLPRALSRCFSSTWTMRCGNSKLVPIRLAGQVGIGAGGDGIGAGGGAIEAGGGAIGAGGDGIGGVGAQVGGVMVEQDVDVKVFGTTGGDVHLVVVVVLVVVV